MNKENLIEILTHWNFWRRDLDIGVYRGVYLDKVLRFIKTNKVISIVGVRRSGKSTLRNF
jgi:predicted AAA+ superfamily ATPase